MVEATRRPLLTAQVDEPDGRRPLVAGAGVAWPFDPVGVVSGSADGAGVGAVPPGGVEVAWAGDAGHDRGEGSPGLVRGKAGSAARRQTMRTVRRNLTRSGSMPTSVAAWQISAEMA